MTFAIVETVSTQTHPKANRLQHPIPPERVLFAATVRQVFDPFLLAWGYEWSGITEAANEVRVAYRHHIKPLVFVVENNEYPPDYGCTVYLHQTELGQQNILYNIPLQRQDAACLFITQGAASITSDSLLEGLISGRIWLRLNHVYLQQ